ncbi:hypothetical protein E3N88_16971 [Mikania micrantha]|uniref:Replication factor A C-terminal domain-containing protein n=1 Tax=Mikania micrantha TaxID=192012 RepID=A0A5N6NST9_9ASTR|nr:hypothetical protein E3N88_16971 [Mikania micrantha]
MDTRRITLLKDLDMMKDISTLKEMPGGKISKLVKLELEDLENNYLPVSLWDQYAEQFDTFLNDNQDDRNIVIILQFGKFKPFKVFLPDIKDDFLINNDLCTIGEIGEVNKPKSLIIVGEIKGFTSDLDWYYSGCSKCNSKVITATTCTLKPDGSADFDVQTVLECKSAKCKNYDISAIPRY